MDGEQGPEPESRPIGAKAGTTRHTVAEAAALLGISERATRKRMKAGTVASEQAEGRWWVFLSDTPASGPVPGQAGPGPEPPNHEAGTVDPEAGTAAGLVQLVRELQRQNVELAGQVGYLQGQLQEVRARLPDSTHGGTQAEHGRKWWQRWAKSRG